MLDFHRSLLADSARTLAFRDAIRRAVRRGDVVVDLGSGTGVLAFFAIEAGAARVYAIEQQHSAAVAGLLARHNGYADQLIVVHEHSRNAELPERANVLISETLGMLGLDEQLLGAVIDARRRFLGDGATLVPQRVVVEAAPVALPDVFARHVAWWSEPRYGLDLAPLRTFASNVIYGRDITDYLAAPAAVIDADLRTIDSADTNGTATFTIERDGTLHGFGAWFHATLADGITLTNRTPRETHWLQAFLPLEHAVDVKEGDQVALELQTSDGRAWRWRGRAGNHRFDQTTHLSAPPCPH